ncbi:MAG: sulfatase-like hydrolase/transferase [Planctomycetaceae bacterium]
MRSFYRLQSRLLSLLLCSLFSAAPAAESRRPNVVLIYVDDMGFGDISCFRQLGLSPRPGQTRVDAHYPPTPQMDRLAAEGIRLTQFYTASPICSPSRVALTTGQYPARHLINSFLNTRASNRAHGMRDYLDPAVPTIARSLKLAGYATAHFGKWHMGGGRDVDDAPPPAAYGFDESLVSFEGLGDRILPPGGLSKQSEQLGQGTVTWVDKHEQSGIYVDRSLDFITRHKGQPFYLQLWLNDVHDGHAPKPGTEEEFQDDTTNVAEQKFFAVLTAMDREIGRLVAKVDELGLGKDTIIILTSDNGPTAWPSYYQRGQDAPGSTAGFRGRKWSLYEGGIRMPFIARWTGRFPAGAINRDSVVSTIDLFPTLAALTGINLTKSLDKQGVPSTPSNYFDGLDMSAVLLGDAPVRTRPLFWEYGRDESYLRPGLPSDVSPNLAVRDGQWKLLVNSNGSRLELYDFSQSQTEFENVAGKHEQVAQRLKEEVLTWRRCLPALDPQEESIEQHISKQFGHSEHTYRLGDVIPAAAAPSIASAPFAVTAEVVPDGTDGVIAAQGGSQTGWAIYIQDQKLKFTTRIRGQETTFTTDAPPVGKPIAIGATLLGDGAMSLHLGQDLPQVVMAPSTIPNMPGDGLEIGRDNKSAVGNYTSPFAWTGEIRQVTVSIGAPLSAGPPPTLVTRFAADLDPAKPLPEYPRPQMVRENWLNLNGYWNYAIAPGRSLSDGMHDVASSPDKWDGRILVPFCAESLLSGVRKTVGHDHALWYHRKFTVPKDWNTGDVILHFGAVDWETYVWVNGKPVTVSPHRGGYDPFSYRIGHLLKSEGENEITVRVWDPTDARSQPRGKQVSDPRGIWYTPVTGIWQTVWLEAPPGPAIDTVHCTPDLEQSSVRVEVAAGLELKESPALPIEVKVLSGDQVVATATGDTANGRVVLDLTIPEPKLWTPDFPFLYDVEVRVARDGGDTVRSYFGMRSIAIGPAADGFQRMLLNGQPVFQFGPLDQGWWPDGLYTAPTDDALKYDIEVTKQMGFNMARKHVKVEPQRWYYWCDKLGLLVWQDLPSGMAQMKDQHVRQGQPDAVFTPEEHAQYQTELQAMIDTHKDHPCIVVWVPFNEGWGQHETNEVLAWTKQYDPSRLVDGPSGWEDRGFGHLKDLHRYPGPDMFPTMADRVSVLGEFGGLGWPVPGHLWVDSNNWGYRTYTTQGELIKNYESLIAQMPSLIANGLAAAVYTQTTDVEIEVNGLLTYDRQIIKMDPQRLATIHRPLYASPPKRVVLSPTSEAAPEEWRFTTTAPVGDAWTMSNFDDATWTAGPGGFGTKITPNTFVRTVWDSPDIWVRRSFAVPNDLPHETRFVLRLFHDEDAQVFLNGKAIANQTGYLSGYQEYPVPEGVVQPGENRLAIHCHQTDGGQYIDAGIIALHPLP